MKSDFIQTRRGRSHYLKWGQGREVILAFHGFGHRAERFQRLANLLPGDFSFYALDLPFHGITQWSFPEFTPEDLLEIIGEIRRKEGNTTLWGLGHSLGGRLWLSLFPQLTEQLKGLFLIAPDGLRTRGLGLAMRLPLYLRQSVARSIQQPDAWLQLAGWANQARLLQHNQYRFIKKYLEDQQKREKLIQTWLSLRHFQVDEKRIYQVCHKQRLPIQVLLGKKDPLIPEKKLSRQLKQWPQTEVTYTEAGHTLQAETTAAWLKSKI